MIEDDEEVRTEVITVCFRRTAQPVADYEDVAAYTDHRDDAIMWAWEFTRRTHWYQTMSDLNLLLLDSEERDKPIPEDIKLFLESIFDALGLETRKEDGSRVVDDEMLARAMLLGESIKEERVNGFRANWRRDGYWQHPEGPPDDMHRPNLASHRKPGAPWATNWPGMRTALRMTSDNPDSLFPTGLIKTIRRVTVGGISSFKSRRHYESERAGDSSLPQRLAHFAFDLSLPIEYQLAFVREELAFMQQAAIDMGAIDRVKKAESLPGKNGVLMLRYLDASVDEREPNDSQIMRAFGWEPSSNRSRFKRLRERAIAFRDEVAPALCDLRY